MQIPRLKCVFWIILLLCGGCQSSRPSLLSSSSSAPFAAGNHTVSLPDPVTTLPVTQNPKTVAFPREKVLYAASLPEAMPVLTLPPDPIQKYLPDSSTVKKRKKSGKYVPEPTRANPSPENEHRLSGIFIGTGMAVLLASLVLVLVGSGAAGTVAIIGGIIFIIGFIICMDSLLGD